MTRYVFEQGGGFTTLLIERDWSLVLSLDSVPIGRRNRREVVDEGLIRLHPRSKGE
jgi:hypothetical protein